MSNEKNCSNCANWVSGECHAGRPQADTSTRKPIWPLTAAGDWCSDHSSRIRVKGKRSKASDGAILRLILDENKYTGTVTRSSLISDIRMNFNLSRNAAVSRVNVLAKQGLISLPGDVVRVERPELADEEEILPV